MHICVLQFIFTIGSMRCDAQLRGIGSFGASGDEDECWELSFDLKRSIQDCIALLEENLKSEGENLEEMETAGFCSGKVSTSLEELIRGNNKCIVPNVVRTARKVTCLIDKNIEGYSKLCNARNHPWVRVPEYVPGLPEMRRGQMKWKKPYKGVFVSKVIYSDTLKMGRCVIQPGAIKPWESTGSNRTTVLMIIRGVALVKVSNEFSLHGDPPGNVTFKSISVPRLATVNIPQNSAYSVENSSQISVVEIAFHIVYE